MLIAKWSPDHPRWPEWERLAHELNLVRAIIDPETLAEDVHFLAALVDDALVGLLMFLVQPIGPEMEVPIVKDAAGKPLTEAKIRAFHVLPDFRNRGLGTALQREVLRLAPLLHCYQVRSRSELDKQANYAIKLKLGFAMHPALRVFRDGTQSPGVYWVRPCTEAIP